MRKPKTTQKQDLVGVSGRDLFQTPDYAVGLLLNYMPTQIKTIWECAAGECKIADFFVKKGYDVLTTDIRDTHNHSPRIFYYNFVSGLAKRVDYEGSIESEYVKYYIPKGRNYNSTTAIVTNPPFSLKKKFFDRCIEYDYPFALLIPADYCVWTIEAVSKYGCEKIVPERRIDYITPNGHKGKDSKSQFHFMWLTRYFNIGSSETFACLSNEDKLFI